MTETGEDYSDIVIYFSNLFMLKRIREVNIDKYSIYYTSCELFKGKDIDDVRAKVEFPEPADIDRIRSISFQVKGISSGKTTDVKISWDSVEMIPTPEEKDAEQFMDQLDRSTFRYF
ncbi:MAG: hypothetical protein QW597_06175 [Thermoplasmataceae archaeon]